MPQVACCSGSWRALCPAMCCICSDSHSGSDGGFTVLLPCSMFNTCPFKGVWVDHVAQCSRLTAVIGTAVQLSSWLLHTECRPVSGGLGFSPSCSQPRHLWYCASHATVYMQTAAGISLAGSIGTLLRYLTAIHAKYIYTVD